MECLSGIRAIDFSWVGAGAYCALLARFLGAEVIKIESKYRLDITRNIQPKNIAYDVNASALFNEMNLGKKSITLNLSTPDGIDIAKRLIRISDLVVENFRPGVMKKLGLDYQSLASIKSDIVMVSYSLSGQVGPEANYLGYAPVAGATSGLSYLLGYPDELPSPAGGDFDLITGAASLVPVVAALCYRQKTGKGQYVDFSSREAGINFVGEAVMDYSMNCRNQLRQANRDPVAAPNNCYRCKGEDAWISISIATDADWAGFCQVAANRLDPGDPRFCDSYHRYLNQDILDGLIEEWTLQHSDYELMEMLQKAGIAAMPSFNTEQLSNDRHIRDRGIVQKVNHPFVGEIGVLGVPWTLSGERPDVHPGPLLGEDNYYVFHDLLGLTEAEMKHLENNQTIY
jgi:benzylsuccinate CoA-transferase BbsF subunit